MAKIYWNNLEEELIQAIKNPVVQGVVKKINDKVPDADGLVTITAADLGAITQAQLTAALADVLKTTDVIDTLTSDAADKPLSAKQGKALKALIDAIDTGGTGLVKKINTKLPDENGLVTLTAADVDAYTMTEIDADMDIVNNEIADLKTDKLNKTDLVNDLTTGGIQKALTAEQGKVLKALIDAHQGMSPEDKTKLDGIEVGANKYVLPKATAAVIGGVRPDGVTILIDADGIISAKNAGEEFTQAEKTKLANIEAEANKYVLPVGSATVLGGLKPDGTTIKVTAEGVISTEVADLSAYIKTVNTTITPDVQGNIVLTIGDLDGYTKAETNAAIKVTDDKVVAHIADATVHMTQAEKDKLAGIEDEANKYVLPIATDLALGGIRIGTGLEIDGDGIVNATATSEYSQVAAFLPTVKHNEAPIKIGVTSFLSKDAATFNIEWQTSLKLPTTVTRFHVQTYKNDSTAIVPFQIVTAFQGTNYYAQYTRSATALNWGVWKQVNQFDMLPILPDADLATLPVGLTSFFAVAGDANSGTAYTVWLAAIGEATGNDTDRFIHVHTERTLSFSGVQTVTLYNTADGAKKEIAQYYRLLTGTTTWGQFNKVESEQYVLPVATSAVLGGVKQGTGVEITADGTLNVSVPDKPEFGKFTAVTTADATHDFIYTPNKVLKPTDTTDNLIVVYNTTTLGEGDFSIEEVGGVRVIVLSVEEADTVARNTVTGFILRGFAPLS